jgi:hypothetical protein
VERKKRKSVEVFWGSLVLVSLSRTSRSPLLEELLIDGTERKRKRKKSEKNTSLLFDERKEAFERRCGRIGR